MANDSELIGLHKDLSEVGQPNNNSYENTKDVKTKTIRDTFYGRIDVSVKTMDIIITILLVLLMAAIIIGVVI